MFERGIGTELWDVNGKRYLDFLCGIAVTSLGHSHPEVTKAIAEQAATLMHVSNFFTNPVATETALLIDELLGGGGQVFLCNSGAESVEAAIKLARKFGGRGRHSVVSAFGSFHGRTLAALAATGQPAKHEPFQPMPEGFRHVAFGDIAALEKAVDGEVAAVLLEPIQGEGGVIPATNEYLHAVRALCTERGALLMMDEVQTGFARTGRWFGFEHAGIKPDVVTLAKAMGNGMPIGALWATKSVAGVFQPGDHGSTFSGTAIATAAARATIQVLKKIDAPERARLRGEYLRASLQKIPAIIDVRGRGLLLGAELRPGIDAKLIYNALLERGLVTNAVSATALRLAPPITVSTEEIDEAVAIIADVLK
jgi:predicted acetylornithine/succinylornithine family transaminase